MIRKSDLFISLLFMLVIHCGESMAQAATTEPLADQLSTRSWHILQQITSEIGARPAGSAQEKILLHDFTARYWRKSGSQPVNNQRVTFGKDKSSANVWITLPGKSDQHIVIAAHADSTGEDEGSQGATDNGIAVALLLALGEQLSTMQLRPAVTLILFGAEEVGLIGSKAFVNSLQADNRFFGDAPLPTAMINLDTIAGGDYLYIHSPTQKPYKLCADSEHYSPSTIVRDTLLHAAQQDTLPFQLHPAYPDYPAGETGGWSDHAPFACAGIPIGYIEATNFSINGREGYDGYSQALHPSLWNCLDRAKRTACNRDQERRWGRIWHTHADQLVELNKIYPGRLRTQLHAVTKLMLRFLAANNSHPQYNN